jgi:predicted transcriptional regulator
MSKYATNEEILDVIAKCGGCVPAECIGHDCVCRIQAKAIELEFRVGRRARVGRALTFKLYTKEEIEQIETLLAGGSDVSSISSQLGRSYNALYRKVRRLKIQKRIVVPIKEEVKGLTKRQKEALDAIKLFWNEHGYAPSYEVIAQKLNAKSKSTVFRLVQSLEDAGYITRRSHRARSVRPVDQPE